MDSTTPKPTQSDLLLGQVTSKLEVTLKIETKPPNALICTICGNLITDPIMMGCCGSSFCTACVWTKLNNSFDYVCPGDGCNQIGCVGFVSNHKLSEIATYWLERYGSEKWRSPTQNTTQNKLAPVEICPPSLMCPICTDVMTSAVIMNCCGTSFCNRGRCIERIISCSDDTACPGAGCTCKHISRDSYSIHYQLQNVARAWFDRFEILLNDENSKMLEPTTRSGKPAIDQQSNMDSPIGTNVFSQYCSVYEMTQSSKKLAITFSPYHRHSSRRENEQGRQNGKQKHASRNLRSAFKSKQSSENTSDDQNVIVLD